MRKIVGFMTLIIMLINSICFVYSSENDLDIVIKGKLYDEKENSIILNYEIINNNLVKNETTLIFAIFDQNQKMITQKNEVVVFESSKTIHKRITIPVLKEYYENSILKVFSWDSLLSMKPTSKIIENPISNIPITKDNIYFDFSEPQFQQLGKITEEVTVDGITFIGKADGKNLSIEKDGSIYFYGGGKIDDCSIKFGMPANCKIDFYVRPLAEESRYLKIMDTNGNSIDEKVISGGKTNVISYYNSGTEKSVFVASKSSGIKIYKIEFLYDYDDTEKDIYYAHDFKSLKSAIFKAENNGSGIVYIKADKIDCNALLTLEMINSNVTISGAEGYKAILDFKDFRDSFDIKKQVGEKSIVVRGSNYILKNIIVQNAPGTGIQIYGANANDNIIENVISRYNAGSGIRVGKESKNNLVKNCYVYRNCDIVTMGENADGFAPAIFSGTGNKFIDCYAWENSDDGFDSFAMYEDITYENCMLWNNGNPDVYTGKYDFDRGYPLDTNLRLVQLIQEVDPSFKSKYENGVFELPEENFIDVSYDLETYEKISPSSFVGDKWEGNPNGFKLGSGLSQHGPQVTQEATRYLKNCIAFNHKGHGFDRNNSTCTVFLENTLSFGNGSRNYWLDACTIGSGKNVFFGEGKNKVPENFVVSSIPTLKMNVIKQKIYDEVSRIENCVYSDKIPMSVNFDEIFALVIND